VTPELFSALADGATAITPNRRLARQLQRGFDRRQLELGLSSWKTASILPYVTWLETLWGEGRLDHDAEAAFLATAAQSTQLWRQFVEVSSLPLLDTEGAARLASEAWTLLHGWGTGGDSWRAWRRDQRSGDDASMFAEWAEAYSRALRRDRRIDAAQLADALVARAHSMDCADLRVVLVGFLQASPQQQRLVAALTARGGRVEVDTPSLRASTPMRTRVGTPRDELIAALTWARERALANPSADIGIVVEDLAQRRDEVIALADEILCPALSLPAAHSDVRPYEISLGERLNSVPIVNAALTLIELAEGVLPAGEAAALLRSPYLPDADLRLVQRAAIERDWFRGGLNDIKLGDAIAALNVRSPNLSQRWRAARDTLPSRTRATPREWVDGWRTWLAGAGWPGEHTLESAEYQAREAWDALLSDFVRIGAVVPQLTRVDALGALRALAQERLFQPEGTDAPIQLLGVLEGAGLEFDALWVAGLTADKWPRPPSPHPLLPLQWQRARDVPGATAAGELTRARALTASFAAAAPEVVFSSPSMVDDYRRAPSVMLLDYPEMTLPPRAPLWTQTIVQSRVRRSRADDHAPALAPGTSVRGGSQFVTAQSDCPFQAIARHRLDVEPWPTPLAGLSAIERGIVLHAMMEAFWERVRNHVGLARLSTDELALQIEAAVERGRAALPVARWRALPEVVRSGESRRLATLLAAWLAHERLRPPFAVTAIEIRTGIELAGHRFGLRIDRVDTLDGGGVAIIDYKAGKGDPPVTWFNTRPRGSQLGMYALAQRAAQPDVAVRAILYACLRPDAIGPLGISMDELAWPGLSRPNRERFPDWPALQAWWDEALTGLGAEIAGGWAAVAPRTSPSPCRSCGMQSLCRIDSVRHTADDESVDE
jgi:probable DNA repair protein